MPTVGTSSKPAYVYDAGTDTWIPIGPGEHTHAYVEKSTLTTTGDIIYASAANTPERLGIGSSGQVLGISAGVPSWTTPSSGGMTLISEQVASAVTSLSFSSISGSYKQLMVVWSGIKVSNTSGTYIETRFNNDTASNYAYINSRTNDTSLTTNRNTATYAGIGLIDSSYAATDLQEMGHGWMLIDNYASTTKYKKYHSNHGYYTGGANQIFVLQGVYKSTNAITSIDFFRWSGTATFSNDTNTSIRLYGIS